MNKHDHESRRFYILRFIVSGLFTVGYIYFLGHLIYSLMTDTPILIVERYFLDEIDVPDMEICASSTSLQILRCDFVNKDGNNNQINRCNDYIIHNVVNLGKHREFCYTFEVNKTIKFAHPDLDGLQRIGFYFYENTTEVEAKKLGIASISVQLSSPDFNPLRNPEQVVSQMDNATLSELKLQWNFIAGMTGYVALVKFKTSIYKAILPGDINAIIGFSPDYHSTPKIENLIHYFPFNENPFEIPDGTTGYFSVAAGSFIREQKVEKRSATILSTIAAAGGAFGAIGGIFILLFGESPLNPWGVMHKILKQHKNTHTLLFNEIDDDLILSQPQLTALLAKHRSTLSQDDRSKLIEHELAEIKLVINSYLLDTSSWKKSVKMNDNENTKRFELE